MYAKPREAKKLYFDVIPRAVDDYQTFLDAYSRQDSAQQLTNPVWHIHQGSPPTPEVLVSDQGGRTQTVTFALLLNLVAVANADSKDVLWAFLKRYAPSVSPATHPRLDALVGFAIRYFQDFVKPQKRYRQATEDERQALAELSDAMGRLPKEATPEEIQQAVYDVGRRDPYKTVQKDGSTGVSLAWFNTLYQVLLGEEKGPRFGSFAALYGIDNTRALIGKALKGELG
jgi:lysyl-tRNA synthetase class 1